MVWLGIVFFFKQKTAYEMRISDWSSDVCSSDLPHSSMTCRLFQTSAQLVPIAVRASTRWSSIIGMEKAEIAKEKAANRPPISVPTTSMAMPVDEVNSIGAM